MRRPVANPLVTLAACVLALSWAVPSLSAAREASMAPLECTVVAGLLRSKAAPKAATDTPIRIALLSDAGAAPIDDAAANTLWALHADLGAFPPRPAPQPDTASLARTCDWAAYGLTVTLSTDQAVPADGQAQGYVVCDSPAPPMNCASQVRVPARGFGFSRPLISRDGAVALIEFSYECGLLCGGGEVCVMRLRADGSWAIDVCDQTWIS